MPEPGPRPEPVAVRPAIAAAWDRAHRAGLTPSAVPDPAAAVDVESDSRLVTAARPVMDQLARELEGTRFALVLADREARVVDHRVGERALRDALAAVGLVTGTVWDERTTGTNSVATVFETRRGLSVVGEEHYLHELQKFCCYGEPLFDPVSGRLEGVIDITGPVADRTDLLGPFLARARHEIEQRLLDTSRDTHQRLLRAYETASTGARIPVLALGEDMLLANQPATEQLRGDDIAVLRALVAQGRGRVRTVPLAGGGTARIDVEPVGAGGAVVRVLTSAPGRPLPRPTARAARVDVTVLVVGEGGTGRTTAARRRLGPDAACFDAADAHGATWVDGVRAALHAGHDVLVDDVHLLPAPAAARLRSALRAASPTGRVVATCSPLAGLPAEHAGLAALFTEHVTLDPLRDDRGRLPGLVTAVLAELTGGAAPTLAPALAQRLAAAPWPGNLYELRAVLAHLVRVAEASPGRILQVADLPARYQVGPAPRPMTPLERSEYETIVRALVDAGGNKLQAARQLGIARGTLYSRMRRFKIPA